MNALVMNCSPVKTGATAEIARIASEQLSGKYKVKSVCIDDYDFAFCKGCRKCHETAACVQQDEAELLMAEIEKADVILAVSPSYWADVPGQFKAFIDRCTPWCNTHEPYKAIPSGKKGYVIALRTGPSLRECEKIIGTLEHFYGHLDIACGGGLGLPSVEHKEDVAARRQEIIDFCKAIVVIGSTVSGTIDRPLGSAHPDYPEMIYPINYGYVNGVFADDGEEQDVYVLGTDKPLEKFEGRVIAVYHRTNDNEDKWVVSLDEKGYSDEEILELVFFQEKYYEGRLIR